MFPKIPSHRLWKHSISLFLLLITALISQAQEKTDSITPAQRNEADSAYVNALNERAKVVEDSLDKKIDRLTNIKAKTEKQVEAIKKDFKGLLKSYKDKSDSLQVFFSTRKDSLNGVLENKMKSLDSANTALTVVVNKSKNAKVSLDSLQDKITSLVGDIALKEDSLEVIARIALKPNAVVHLDKEALVRELKMRTSPADSNRRKDLLAVVGKRGFRLFDSATIREMALNNDYTQIPDRFEKPIRITEVNIDVSEGVIRELIVKTNYGIYRNISSPIDLVRIGKRLDDRLPRDGEAIYKHEYLKVGEVIEYIPKRSFNDLPYTQFSKTLLPDSLKPDRGSYLIQESTSINTYFDVAVYTDIKGISGEPNGIAQLSGNAKFITNTANIRNTATIFFNYVSFVGGFSKFDKSFKGTTLLSGDSISRKDLLQRATYNVGVKVNLFRGILSPYPKRLVQDMQLNAGFNFIGANVLKSYVKDPASPDVLDTSYSNVTHNQVYIEPIISFARYRNFNMAISAPLSVISLKESSGIANRKNEIWIRPSVDLMYYAKRDSNSKIFFRYNHWINLQTKVDAFLQIQLGYSASITDLFSRS